MSDSVLVDGRYLLRQRLGAGAFGTVYRAEQLALGVRLRPVALKLFDTERLAIPGEELLHEALTLIAIIDDCGDPAIRDLFVRCYDAGLAADRGTQAYIAMELAQRDLASVLGGSALPVRAALRYAVQITRAVAFLHERGHLHRDLKPDNILLTGDGRIKICDFGLAVATGNVLRSAPAAGTLIYQAPEALALRECTPASDVYSIGLICYEMLTGALPYPPELMASAGQPDLGALVDAKLTPVPPPSQDDLELRAYPEFVAAVLGALDTTGARFPDATALLRALESAERHQPAAPPRRSTPQQVIRDRLSLAEAALRRGDPDGALKILDQARAANAELPDERMVADLYPLLVRTQLRIGRKQEARRTASEGLSRRRCQATYHASALAHDGTGLAATFRQLAREASS